MIRFPSELAARDDLLLRKFTLRDAEPLFALIDRNREHLSQYGEETGAKYPTLASVVESIAAPPNPEKIRMGIWTPDGLVGSINLTPITPAAEIGYYLGAEYTGKGYMAAAVKALSDCAFDHGFTELLAIIHPANLPSQRVVLKTGYVQSGDWFGKKMYVKMKDEKEGTLSSRAR